MADPESRDFLEKYSRGEEVFESQDPAWRLGFANLVARQLEVYERAKTECNDVGARAVDGSIYGVAERAAALGDRDAAYCYVSMAWPMDQAHWQDTRFRARYRASAARLVDAGIAAGDWRMVGMARIAAGEPKMPFPPPGATGPEASVWLWPSIRWLQATDVDPQRELALLRLLQAGTTNAAQAGGYRKLGDLLAGKMTPAQARDASDWAERTFRTAFKETPDHPDNFMSGWACQ